MRIIEENDVSAVYILGDFNAHPSARFGQELVHFCEEHHLVCADLKMLGVHSDNYTYVSDVHGTCRWLDHCVTTDAAWNTITSVDILYDTYTSDHLPLRIVCDFRGVPQIDYPKDSNQSRLSDKVRWGNRESSQIESYYNFCKSKLSVINDVLTCSKCDINDYCDNKAEHSIFIEKLYTDIINVLKLGAINSASVRSSNPKKTKRITGWNMHVRESHQAARMYFQYWSDAGRPSTGKLYEDMCNSRKTFKNKLRWCQNNEDKIKLDILTMYRKDKNFMKFWNATKNE